MSFLFVTPCRTIPWFDISAKWSVIYVGVDRAYELSMGPPLAIIRFASSEGCCERTFLLNRTQPSGLLNGLDKLY